jgi:hypothetical protein
MKSTKDIINDIKEVEREAEVFARGTDKKSERAYSRLSNRADFLYQMKRYSELESFSEQSLRNQMQRTSELIERLTMTFKKEIEPQAKDIPAAWKKYRQDNNMTKLNKSIKTLQYLLS